MTSLDALAAELIEITPRFLTLIRRKVKEHAGSDLTMPQLRIVSQLKDGALSNSELADRCGIDITSMSRMADHLVKRGYITRSVNREDKRCVKLQLTAKGKREQESVGSAIRNWIATNMEGLTSTERAELSQGLKILGRLESRMLQHSEKPFQSEASL